MHCAATRRPTRRAHPNIQPFKPWPAPPQGHRLRVYDLDVPPQPGRFGRIWRCSTLMVNVHPARAGTQGSGKALTPIFMTTSNKGPSRCRGRSPITSAGPGPRISRIGATTTTRFVRRPSLAVIPPPAIHHLCRNRSHAQSPGRHFCPTPGGLLENGTDGC